MQEDEAAGNGEIKHNKGKTCVIYYCSSGKLTSPHPLLEIKAQLR